MLSQTAEELAPWLTVSGESAAPAAGEHASEAMVSPRHRAARWESLLTQTHKPLMEGIAML